MKRFAFVNEAATREYKDLPSWVQDEFGKDLMRVQYSADPELAIKQLSSVGAGAIELIINGSPAYRCIYIAKYADTIFVLHSFVKTTNRTDRHAMAVAQDRLKELKSELRKMGFNV
ncbi:type II toxin-antitoxin system RelE/ParE family toxin [Pseudomonas migulae]|uniref:Type II toxin-antitoxin system RelE/ParE family toxin n=1 Tax=Pseudomonas migulae TaxID=78543 RepID=A0ABY8MWD9_9PSED|nr:type II toxin-antitoxin system RelE/ParE family toxin [Pseudomonas migulae]WGK90871.1 type II toxin-antitoxin system RelE/ParE family toxin [Pseudomonas migulae]